MFKKLILAATIITLCLTAQLSHASDTGKVRLITPAYACALTTTNLAKAVLNRAGIDSEITMVSVATMWKALELGEADATLAAWLPSTHGEYYEACKDSVENLGVNTAGARLGWVVPSYVDIDSISELNAHKDQFNDEIVGIAPSAGLMLLSEKAIKDYNIDMDLVPSSGAAMTAVLGDAIRQNKWVVVTGWPPPTGSLAAGTSSTLTTPRAPLVVPRRLSPSPARALAPTIPRLPPSWTALSGTSTPCRTSWPKTKSRARTRWPTPTLSSTPTLRC